MKITAKQYAISLYESTRNIPDVEIEKRIRNFVEILKRNNDLSLKNKIIQQYKQHFRNQKNISKIEITSSEKLDSETLNKILKKESKQVEIEEKIDPSIIGGIIIKIDDNILIDGSAKKKLGNLEKEIA